jgi:hypothetical protein
MIDDIRLVETLPKGNGTVYGLAGTAIALPVIAARLADTDGSETLKIELLGLPAGARVSDGVRSVTFASGQSSIDLSGWNLAKLRFTPPSGDDCGDGGDRGDGSSSSYQLQVRATATERSNGAGASVTHLLKVVVLSGSATATPVGVNPYVTLVNCGGVSNSDLPTLQDKPIVDADGTGCVSAAPPSASLRTWEEEQASDRERAQAPHDEWLRQMEAAAQLQWAALMAP